MKTVFSLILILALASAVQAYDPRPRPYDGPEGRPAYGSEELRYRSDRDFMQRQEHYDNVARDIRERRQARENADSPYYRRNLQY